MFRRWVIGIVTLSAILRLWFLFYGDVLPVMWDARRYSSAALGLISFVDRTNAPTKPEEKESPNRLKYYNDKYIQGEQIVWKPYSPSTLKAARNDILIGGPLYPLVLATVFYVSPASDLFVARFVGVLMDLLSTLLILLIAARLVGRKAAIVAGFTYAIYFPFIQTSTMLLLENSTTLLMLLSLYFLLRARDDGGRRSLLMGGVAAALLILNKPSAMFLWAPLACALYVSWREEHSMREKVRRVAIYLAPTAIVLGTWLTIASMFYGQLTLKEPTYQESSLRQSSAVESEGYDLDIVALNFWTRPVYSNLLSNWLEYGGLFVKKFTRLWSRPFNDFRRHFLFPYEFDEQLHVGIMLFGFIGLVLLTLTNLKAAVWPISIILYYTAIHVVFHSVSRYSFSAIPMVMIGMGFLVVSIGGCLRDRSRLRWLQFAGFSAAVVMAWAIDIQWIETILGGSVSRSIVYTGLIAKTLLLAAGLILLQKLLLSNEPRVKRVLFVVTITLSLTLVGWNSVLARDSWSDFAAPLPDPGMKAGTRLYISQFEIVDSAAILAVVVDGNTGREVSGSYTVRVGNLTRDFRVAVDPPSNDYYIKSNYEYFLKLCNDAYPEIRQYVVYPLDPKIVKEYIDSRGYIDITIAPNWADSSDSNYIVIYGNRAAINRAAYVPSIPSTSIERYVYADDPRIRTRANFMSDSAVSYYIDRTSSEISRGQDLSILPGVQRGRYNLFLVVLQNGTGELY